jgi:hypothetical protein
MQVREVGCRSGRTLEGRDIRHELNQVTRDEARREPEVAQQLDQQPRRVPAGSAAELERPLRRLDAGVEPDDVADVVAERTVQFDEEVVCPGRLPSDRVQIGRQPRRQRLRVQERLQLAQQRRVVLERHLFGGGFQEEVERVVDRHLGDEVDVDPELADRIREVQSRDVVAVRILLPVDEVAARLDAHRIREDRRPALRRRTQPDQLRAQTYEAVVAVVGRVSEGNMNRHVPLC